MLASARGQISNCLPRSSKSLPRLARSCRVTDDELATIELEAVTKVYPNGVQAVYELDMQVGEAEFLVLVGPSGCGKTTVLRMVAGLERLTSGSIRIGGRDVSSVAPKERDIAMVFQNYALYPHMTVAENIGFALKLRKVPKAEIARRVRAAAGILDLLPYLDRRPAQLSGGQRQRVAMGRAMVRNPSAFLMDEPLSNLDAKLRVQMRAELSQLQRRLGVATMYVTHDQTEAMTMGDRVAVMRSGKLQQCDVPQALYDHPVNLFVAAFMGSPSMNLLEAVVGPGGSTLQVGAQEVAVPGNATNSSLVKYVGRKVALGLRPEDLHLASRDSPSGLKGTVELVEALGPEKLLYARIEAIRVMVEDAVSVEGEAPEPLHLDLSPQSLAGDGAPEPVAPGGSSTETLLVLRAPSSLEVRTGDRVEVGMRMESAHYFDLESGVRLD
jgi:multiple sugar transport system ATP-binding protein